MSEEGAWQPCAPSAIGSCVRGASEGARVEELEEEGLDDELVLVLGLGAVVLLVVEPLRDLEVDDVHHLRSVGEEGRR